jgi:hypothetical protein
LLECSAGRSACPEYGRPPAHAPEKCDGSCHTAAELAMLDQDFLLGSRDARLRVEFGAAATFPYEELEDAPALIRGAAFLFALMAAEGRALAAVAWRALTAMLTFARRGQELARLALAARLRRRTARAPRFLACRDHVTIAPRTGPPAGRGGLFSHGGVLTT